jgi:hypothetical protein
MSPCASPEGLADAVADHRHCRRQRMKLPPRLHLVRIGHDRRHGIQERVDAGLMRALP